MTVRWAAGTLVCALLLVAPVPPAAAAECTAQTGVRVVVDTGAGVRVGCAGGDPSSGRGALASAGFSVSDVPRQPGFICTINNVPAECNGAPADAYWSYWYASAGGAWTYSSRGSSGRDPAPGTVEGWAFGAGSAPSIAPPAVDAPPPPPPPSQPPPPPPANTAAEPAPAPAPSPEPAPSNPAPADTPAATAEPSRAQPSPADPSPAESSAAAPPEPSEPPASSQPPQSSQSSESSQPSQSSEPSAAALSADAAGASAPAEGGTPTGTLVALGLVVTLGAGAGLLGWRRRRGGT